MLRAAIERPIAVSMLFAALLREGVIARAIEVNGCDLTPERLDEALTRVEFDGLSGRVRFSEAGGRQSRPNVHLVRVDDGRLTAVAADPAAQP